MIIDSHCGVVAWERKPKKDCIVCVTSILHLLGILHSRGALDLPSPVSPFLRPRFLIELYNGGIWLCTAEISIVAIYSGN